MQNAASRWLLDQYPRQEAVAVAAAYRRALGGDNPTLNAVWADLRRFCVIRDTTAVRTADGSVDPIGMAILEGRRQVFTHIANVLDVPADDLEERTAKNDDTRRDGDGADARPRYGSDPDAGTGTGGTDRPGGNVAGSGGAGNVGGA